MTFDNSLDISIRFRASAEDVWDALTDPKRVSDWWNGVKIRVKDADGNTIKINAAPGLQYDSRKTVRGRLVASTYGEELHLKLHTEPGDFDSEVAIFVTQLKNKTRLRVVESGLPTSGNGHRIVAECREGWRSALNALRQYLDDE